MHEGKIAYFEDSDPFRRMMHRILARTNHRIVAEAGSLPEALQVLDQIQSGELDVNLVITDGNLGMEIDAKDALAIVNRIRELGLPVRVFGRAGESLQKAGIPVDAELTKDFGDSEMLVKMIDALPEPEQN